jgi:hypothetical protein
MALRIQVVEEPGWTRLWVLYEEGAYHRPLALVPDADMRRLVADYQELAILAGLRTNDPELLSRTVDQVPWPSARARAAMRRLSKQRGLKDRLLTLGELITYTPGDLLAMKNVGVTTLSAIQQTLAGLGLRLRDI